MYDGNAATGSNVEYMLSAEFDNKLGSTIKCQYPNDIPGFDSINLATLMIPDNMEKYPGKIDFTYFMLYFNPTSQCYEFLPSGDEIQRGMDIVYFINICNTILNSSNERGATIKAVSLGSRSRDFIKWKPFLTILLGNMMNDTANDDMKLLSTFAHRINKIDFTNSPNNDLFQQIVQSINDSINEEVLINSILQNIPGFIPKKHDKFKNKISTLNRRIHYTLSPITLPHLPSVLYYKLPVCQNILFESYIPTEIDYNRIALKLIRDINLQIFDIDEIKNIIIYSTKISKDYLCQLIFAVSYLISGVSLNDDPSSQNIFTVPYADISMIEILKAFNQTVHESNIKLIVGTANPIFKIQEDVYDIFYDIDKEEMHFSSKLKLKQSEWKVQRLNISTRSYNFNDSINTLSRGISNLTSKNNSGYTLLPPNTLGRKSNSSTSLVSMNSSIPPPSLSTAGNFRVTLMTSFIQLLIWEHHDNRTILNVIKRVQILQLIPLLEQLDISEINESEVVAITDRYHRTYGDLVYFNELFDEANLKYVKLLYSLDRILETIMDKDYLANVKKSHDVLYSHISQLHNVMKQLIGLISSEEGSNNIRRFIHICMNFPSVDILSTFDVSTKDFKSFSIKKFYTNIFFGNHQTQTHGTKDFDLLKLIQSGHERGNYPIIDKFVANVAFNLLGKFLLFLPHITDKSKHTSSSAISLQSKKKNRMSISRSGSFRNLFSLKVHSEPGFKPVDYSKTVKDVTPKSKILSNTLLLPPSIPRQYSLYESNSSPSSGSKQEFSKELMLSHVLETRINKIKSMIYEIYGIIDGDTLGHILLWGYLDKEIKSHYDTKSNTAEKVNLVNNNKITKPEILTNPKELPIFSLSSVNSQSDSSIISSLKKMDSLREKEAKADASIASEEESGKEEEVVYYDTTVEELVHHDTTEDEVSYYDTTEEYV